LALFKDPLDMRGSSLKVGSSAALLGLQPMVRFLDDARMRIETLLSSV
jgi:hypothetical protein